MSSPAPGPAQLSVPSAASRALLVGLEAFDYFVEDNDIPLVSDGPKWPDPPKLDRDGRLVAFQTETQPVKWGWAETWTSPPPQKWRTTTDGELDDLDVDFDEDAIGLDGSDEVDAPPTTQSPLGRLRGRREFIVGDEEPELDHPRTASRLDQPHSRQPERIPNSAPASLGSENRSVRGPDTVREDDRGPSSRESAWREIQPDIPRQRSFGSAPAPPTSPPTPAAAPPPRGDRIPPTPITPAARGPISPPAARSAPAPIGTPHQVPTRPRIDQPGTEPRPSGRERQPRRDRQPRRPDDTDRPRARRSEPGSDRDGVDQEESTGPSRRRVWIAFAGLSVLFALILQTFVLQANTIPSTSMSPTLIIDDYVLVSKLSYAIGSPSRTDVVVFDRPESVPSEDDVFIKRVIGLPGETVTFVEGKVVIDGEPLDEDYIASPNSTFPLVDQIPGCGPPRPDGGCLIPEDSIFVMGDNRRNSSDSRRFGPIKKDAIEGRAFMRIWPSSRIGGL